MAALPHTTPAGVLTTGLPTHIPPKPPVQRSGNSRAIRAVRNLPKFRAWSDERAEAERERFRQRIEAAVQRLIDALDDLDGDPDLEPEREQDRADEEPWLGWTNHIDQSAPNRCDSCDRELDLGEAA